MQEAIVEQQQPDQEAVAETMETEPVASVPPKGKNPFP